MDASTTGIIAMFVVLGLAALCTGIWLWRNAAAVVDNARRQLEGMFDQQLPGAFDSAPDPLGARIAAVAFATVGVALLVVAVVVAVTA